MANTKNFIAKNGFSTGDGYSMPDVRPSLLLDFANSKTLDPRITFTRGSTATYWDGHTTAKAEENLLLYSTSFFGWTYATGVTTPSTTETAPDGTSTAITIRSGNAGNSGIYRVIDVPIGSTASFYAKYSNSDWVAFSSAAPGNNTWAYFDVTNGAVGFSSGCTASIQSVGNGWYRCILANCLNSNDYFIISLENSNTNSHPWGIPTPAIGTEITLWGPQLEYRDSATAYTGTNASPIVKYQPVLQTAASGAARFDHDPVTGESKGLLIEEARTNLVAYSVTTSASDINGISFEANSAVAPDGTISAALITSDSTNDGHYAYYKNFVRTSGVATTISIFVKPLSMSRGYIWLGTGSGLLPANIIVDTSDWTVTFSNGTASSVTEVGNGWYRLSTTGTATATGTAQIYCGFAASSTSTGSDYVGDPSDRMLLWGFQAETGSFPTSYIPTSGSTVTRSAEIAKITGTNFSSVIPSSAEFSAYAEATAALKDDNRIWTMSENQASQERILANFQDAWQLLVQTNGSTFTNLDAGDVTVGTYSKIGYRLELDNNAVCVDGGNVALDTTTGRMPRLDALYIGSAYDGTENYLNGTIKKLAFYPTGLSNATLQAMTEE